VVENEIAAYFDDCQDGTVYREPEDQGVLQVSLLNVVRVNNMLKIKTLISVF
jgi:hypothetical protein